MFELLNDIQKNVETYTMLFIMLPLAIIVFAVLFYHFNFTKTETEGYEYAKKERISASVILVALIVVLAGMLVNIPSLKATEDSKKQVLLKTINEQLLFEEGEYFMAADISNFNKTEQEYCFIEILNLENKNCYLSLVKVAGDKVLKNAYIALTDKELEKLESQDYTNISFSEYALSKNDKYFLLGASDEENTTEVGNDKFFIKEYKIN